jgi:hypothetical protein
MSSIKTITKSKKLQEIIAVRNAIYKKHKGNPDFDFQKLYSKYDKMQITIYTDGSRELFDTDDDGYPIWDDYEITDTFVIIKYDIYITGLHIKFKFRSSENWQKPVVWNYQTRKYDLFSLEKSSKEEIYKNFEISSSKIWSSSAVKQFDKSLTREISILRKNAVLQVLVDKIPDELMRNFLLEEISKYTSIFL